MADEEVVDQELEEAFAADEHELTDEQRAKIAEAAKTMSPEKIELQREKTRWGRKVKGLEEKYGKLSAEFEALKAPMVKEPVVEAPAVDTGDDPYAAEREEIRELFYEKPDEATRRTLELDKKIEAESKKSYEQGYIGKLESLGLKKEIFAKEEATLSDDEKDLKEIYDEMFKNFNVKRAGNNAAIDAEINWANAKAAVREKMAAEGRKPTYKGPGDKAKSGAGMPPGSQSSESPEHHAPPKLDGKLDAYAKWKAEKNGISYEEAAEGLV